MKASFRQSMAWLHTWSGLLLGWLLLAIFATGLASYFKAEIHTWMRPELHAPADPVAAMARGVDWIERNIPSVSEISLQAPGPRNPGMEAYWFSDDGYGFGMLDPATGSPHVARDTLGGEFFYRFHFELMLPYPWGRYLAGAAAMTMLIAIVSGIITHKRIFKDFFTFRPGKGQRSWLDLHNVLGVLSLPFHLMISFTGLITLMSLLMPAAVIENYRGDFDAYYAAFDQAAQVSPAGVAAPLTAIEPVLRDAAQRWSDSLSAVRIVAAHDTASRIVVERRLAGRVGYRPDALVYDGVTGRFVAAVPRPGAVVATEETLYGLHMGRFSGALLRWLYALSGLTGYAMIATGLILWVVKRRPRHGTLTAANRVIDRLNAGAVAGLPVAMAAFLLANRLLPFAQEGRAGVETEVFVAALVAMLAASLVAPRRSLWIVLMAIAALAFLALPLVNALTTSRGLNHSLVDGDSVMAAFDATLLMIGLGFGIACAAICRRLRAA